MQVNIFLDISGQETIAKGGKVSYWSFSVRPVEGDEWETAPPKGSKLIGTASVTFPDKSLCVQAVVANPREQQANIHLEAAKEVAELKQREEQLLALSYSPSDAEVL
jgi:hypothetical protein